MFAFIVKKQVIDPDDGDEMWFSITEEIFDKLEVAMYKYDKITPESYQMPEFVSNRNGYKFIINQETDEVIKDEDFVIPVGPCGAEILLHNPVLLDRKGECIGYKCISTIATNGTAITLLSNDVSASDEGAQQP
jgi:hypothetical protein